MIRQSETRSPRVEPDPRRSLGAPLIVRRLHPEDGHLTFFGYASNISRSGLFINATCPKEPGEQFEVEIPLPAPLDHAVRCTCEVVWARRRMDDFRLVPGMGVRFVDLPEDEAAAIDDWIEDAQRRDRLGG